MRQCVDILFAFWGQLLNANFVLLENWDHRFKQCLGYGCMAMILYIILHRQRPCGGLILYH